MKLRRIKHFCIMLLVLAGLLLFGFEIITHSHTYLELKEKTYDTLSGMSKGTFHKNENTVIYDKDKNKVGEVDSGNYKYVKIADIPLDLQNAYIAAEDQHFKTHNGVNYFSTFRAGISYIIHHGGITKGGSTITQQVIKNNLLSQEQTLSRKILEISIAPELEKKYSKQDIMEFYCNPATDTDEESDFYELSVVVEKEWLFEFIKSTLDFKTDEEVRKYLQEEYTSDDSIAWYDEAIEAKKVVMVDFN